MLRNPTTFVIGAGAGKVVNMPTGADLIDSIERGLNFTFEGIRGDPQTGNRRVWQAVQEHIKQSQDSPNQDEFRQAALQISNAMPQCESIDNYIAAHEGSDEIELLGKLSIIDNVLTLESQSSMHKASHDLNGELAITACRDTWYTKLFKLLHSGLTRQTCSEVFNNAKFIVFNYDRCLEHFFFHSLQNYFAITPSYAAEIVNSATVFHPYGTPGMLPWQGGADIVQFGEAISPDRLLHLSRRIRTFGEKSDDSVTKEGITKALDNSSTVVFLGFGYHDQNVDLLKIPYLDIKRVFGTALDLSLYNTEAVSHRLRKALSMPPHRSVTLENVNCEKLIEEYSQAL